MYSIFDQKTLPGMPTVAYSKANATDHKVTAAMSKPNDVPPGIARRFHATNATTAAMIAVKAQMIAYDVTSKVIV